jgi:hypothetical protein
VEGTLVNMIMNLQVPYNVDKFLNSFITGSFSRMAQLHVVTLVSLSSSVLSANIK